MVSSLLPQPGIAGLVGLGLPPTRGEAEPIGYLSGLVLIVLFALSFWWSVRFVAWIDVKLSSWALFRDIRRELGIGRPRRGVPGPSRPGPDERGEGGRSTRS